MKRFFAFTLAAIVVLAASGCGSSDSGDKPAPVDKEKDAQTQKGGAAPQPTKD